MDDAAYYVKYLNELSYEKLNTYIEEHPEFMTAFESDDIINGLKEETRQKLKMLLNVFTE